MELVNLELVVAAADAGSSIIHGAARVHLSLPSGSARIRGLEREIGASPFDREHRGVSPTAAGMLVLRHARAVRRSIQQMHSTQPSMPTAMTPRSVSLPTRPRPRPRAR